MFEASVPWYDAIYAWKDYAAEARRLVAVLRRARAPTKGRLLDVACGTGRHLEHLRRRFDAEGIDVSARMLRVARRRLPGVRLHRGDMRTFALGRAFDVVACLFSSVGYMRTVADLRRAVASMARHVAPGGVLVVEPWFSRRQWKAGNVHAITTRTPDGWICRMNLSERRGPLAVMAMHHLVGTPRGVRHVVERHEMRLFSPSEYRDALRRAGLRPTFRRAGVSDRGVWIGHKPKSGRTGAL